MSRRLTALTCLLLLFIILVKPAHAVWNPFSKKTYILVVVNGNGGGTYPAGTKVPLTAFAPLQSDGPPPPVTFAAWLSAGPTAWGSRPSDFANAYAASTTFTMPKHNETVQATFAMTTP